MDEQKYIEVKKIKLGRFDYCIQCEKEMYPGDEVLFIHQYPGLDPADDEYIHKECWEKYARDEPSPTAQRINRRIARGESRRRQNQK